MYKKSFITIILIVIGILFSFSILYWAYETPLCELFETILSSILTGCVFAIPGCVLALCYANTTKKIDRYIQRLYLLFKDEMMISSLNDIEVILKVISCANDIICEVDLLASQNIFFHKVELENISLCVTKFSIYIRELNEELYQLSDLNAHNYMVYNVTIESKRQQCLKAIETYQSK